MSNATTPTGDELARPLPEHPGPDTVDDDTSIVQLGDLAAELPAEADPRGRWIPFNPRTPGFTGTVADWEKAYVIFEEQVRREYPSWTQDTVRREAERRYRSATELRHPKLAYEYAKLMQESFGPPREAIRENLEAAASRRIPEWAALESTLAGCRQGRPSDRRLPVAIFSRATLCSGAPELRRNLKDFAGSNLELDWSFLDSDDLQANAEILRDESCVRRVLKRMLERHDPSQTISLNLQVIKRLKERCPDIGRYLVIDGTPVQAFVEQTVPVNDRHRELVTRETGATLQHHGGGRRHTRKRKSKSWVGWTLLIIADLKSGLPLIWQLIDGREHPHVIPMLQELLRQAPFLDPEYLVGDSEFDETRLALDLHDRYGICPVTPLRDTLSERYEWYATKGVPQCSKHGAMKLVQSEDFMPADVPLAYETDIDIARRRSQARTRWECDQCKQNGRTVRATTWFRDNPRLYTYLPRGGTHRRYATRIALLLRRNAIEALNSQLKRRGIADRAHSNCRWATRRCHVEWLCGAALLGLTVRREAHETGVYDQVAEEAWQRQLFKCKT